MSVHDSYLQHAIALATANVENGGRPFGALIVHRGDIVARAVNTLHQNGDPTAHAELNAIRDVSQHLGSQVLSECIRSNSEPFFRNLLEKVANGPNNSTRLPSSMRVSR